jgi:uncharacterized protein YegJ (DUF2314 family)
MKKVKNILIIVLLANISLLVLSCSKTTPSDDPMVVVDSSDKEMNAAIDQARKSVQQFVAALQSPKADQSAFSIKKQFNQGSSGEHIWLTDVTFDGKTFHGKVGNDPEIVKNIKFGDDAVVNKDEISDWMFIENGKLVGGYTLKVIYSRMSQKEKEDFLKHVPFQF